MATAAAKGAIRRLAAKVEGAAGASRHVGPVPKEAESWLLSEGGVPLLSYHSTSLHRRQLPLNRPVKMMEVVGT